MRSERTVSSQPVSPLRLSASDHLFEEFRGRLHPGQTMVGRVTHELPAGKFIVNFLGYNVVAEAEVDKELRHGSTIWVEVEELRPRVTLRLLPNGPRRRRKRGRRQPGESGLDPDQNLLLRILEEIGQDAREQDLEDLFRQLAALGHPAHPWSETAPEQRAGCVVFAALAKLPGLALADARSWTAERTSTAQQSGLIPDDDLRSPLHILRYAPPDSTGRPMTAIIWQMELHGLEPVRATLYWTDASTGLLFGVPDEARAGFVEAQVTKLEKRLNRIGHPAGWIAVVPVMPEENEQPAPHRGGAVDIAV